MYQRLKKYSDLNLSDNWDETLENFAKFLDVTVTKELNEPLTIERVANELDVHQHVATILLRFAYEEKILVRKYTISNPKDDVVIASFIDPKELPNQITDLRDMSILSSDEYTLKLVFLFYQHLNIAQYNLVPAPAV